MDTETKQYSVNEYDLSTLWKTDLPLWRKLRSELETKTELLLDKSQSRDALYPIKYPTIWEYHKKHRSAHWITEDIEFSKDINDWNGMKDEEKHFIKHTLGFFAGSDFIVIESQEKDEEEITIPEVKIFNRGKMAREDEHTLTYAELLEIYVKDPDEKEKLKNAVKECPSVRKKAEWFRAYIAEGTFVERIFAESIMEGLFFSGSFCSIFWVRKRGLMPALCDSNEFISRDEGLHRDVNCYIYRDLIVNKLPEEYLVIIMRKAVEIEKESVTESLPVDLIGMNSGMMCEYIEYVADHLMIELINKKLYNTPNPFEDWMQAISMEVKADFFVHRPTNYSKSACLSTEKDQNSIRFDVKF